MVVAKVHVGDTKTDFQILVHETLVSGSNQVFDLSDATTKQIIFTTPDGVETTVTATAVNGTGSDGLLRYTNLLVDIATTGFWKYRAKLTLTGGAVYQSNDAIFEVI